MSLPASYLDVQSTSRGCAGMTAEAHVAGAGASARYLHRRRARRGKKRRGHDPKPIAVDTMRGAANNGFPYRKKKRGGSVPLRPADVPQAPANFTQFIIDDHIGSCPPGLYKSFETPPPGSVRNHNWSDAEGAQSNAGAAAADCNYVDSESSVDACYDYSSMMAFYEKDFEEVYSDARAAEVIELSRDRLVSMCGDLEKRVAELSSEISVYSPRHLLDLLQQRLLQLQEENRKLRARNRALRYAHSVHSGSGSDDSDGNSVDSESDSSSSSSSGSSSSSNSSDSSDSSDSSSQDEDVLPASGLASRQAAFVSAGSSVPIAASCSTISNCAADSVNDNAVFQLDDGEPAGLLVGAAQADPTCNRQKPNPGLNQAQSGLVNNESSSSTLDFRSFQDALFNSHFSQSSSSIRENEASPAVSATGDAATSPVRSPKPQQADDGDGLMMLAAPSSLVPSQQLRTAPHEQEIQVTSSCKTPISESTPPYGEIEAMG